MFYIEMGHLLIFLHDIFHQNASRKNACTRAATILSPHDTIRIGILASRNDAYRHTLFRLEIISNCMRHTMKFNYGGHHTSEFV